MPTPPRRARSAPEPARRAPRPTERQTPARRPQVRPRAPVPDGNARPAPRPDRPVRRRVVTPAPRPPKRGPVAHAASAHSGSPAQLTLWAQQLGRSAAYVHVDDQIMWGIFGIETDFGQYIDTSSAQAAGLMQFIPSTARAYNYPLTNYPTPAQSQQQFTAACLYIRDLRKQYGSYAAAIYHYSGGGYTEQEVIGKANTRKQAPYGGGGGTPHTGGGTPAAALYVNPLRDAHVTAERIDDGVDYAGTGYYVALAACVVTRVVQGGWGIYGNVIEYRITQPGNLNGHTVYYNEGVSAVVRQGQSLRAGDRVCSLIPNWHSGTEVGWSAGNASLETWATVYGGGHHVGNNATRAGISFSNLIKHLGGPGGLIQGATQGDWPPWTPGGAVPAGVNPGSGGGGGGTTGGGSFGAAASYLWPAELSNAFQRINTGALEGSHHSHAANLFARAFKYVTAPK